MGRPGSAPVGDIDSGSTIAVNAGLEPWPDLSQLLEKVASGDVTPADAQVVLRRLPFAHLWFARIDHHRWVRTGLAEAIYGPGKTPEQCAAIVTDLLSSPVSAPVVLTRADPRQIAAALAGNPSGHVAGSTVVWNAQPRRSGRIVVVSAGTGDLTVAEECETTLIAYGYDPELVTDVGVAGLHRLLDVANQLQDVDVVVVVAGMEGTLPTAVGGLTGAPIIAVPTSVGYGSSLRGHTALLGMLASCAQGITVMGIDNGFGAACAAIRILMRIRRAAES